MSHATLLESRDARGIVTLTLNRPDMHNAMDAQMMDDLAAAASALGADTGVRAVILTGQGASFCAGGDLGWMRKQISATRPQRMAEARRLADMLNTLNTMPKPLIGAINGAAFGGGVGLASVCDIGCRYRKIRPDRNPPWPDPRHHCALCAGADGRGQGAARFHVGPPV